MDGIFYQGHQKVLDLFNTGKTGGTKDMIDVCEHIRNDHEEKDKSVELKRATGRKKGKG